MAQVMIILISFFTIQILEKMFELKLRDNTMTHERCDGFCSLGSYCVDDNKITACNNFTLYIAKNQCYVISQN